MLRTADPLQIARYARSGGGEVEVGVEVEVEVEVDARVEVEVEVEESKSRSRSRGVEVEVEESRWRVEVEVDARVEVDLRWARGSRIRLDGLGAFGLLSLDQLGMVLGQFKAKRAALVAFGEP